MITNILINEINEETDIKKIEHTIDHLNFIIKQAQNRKIELKLMEPKEDLRYAYETGY